MADRALLVGINRYPDAPLSGCVNDVSDMAAFLTGSCQFGPDSIRMLVDERATTDAIKSRLAWLVSGAKAGDRLLFHYSGHGVQLPARNDRGEVDRLDECICPVDFDWSEDHVLRDDFFNLAFTKLPAGVQFIWVSDSCHSGNLTRELPGRAKRVTSTVKALPMPADIAWRAHTARYKGLQPRRFFHPDTTFPGALISGCRQDETSSDARFKGRANGALTYCLLKVLAEDRRRVLVDVVDLTRKMLAKAGYTQHPQLEGSPTVAQGTFF
jgi:hypothetical protein